MSSLPTYWQALRPQTPPASPEIPFTCPQTILAAPKTLQLAFRPLRLVETLVFSHKTPLVCCLIFKTSPQTPKAGPVTP